MPYRPVHLTTPDGVHRTFLVRVDDAALWEWLRDRPGIPAGYPDRPPDVDTPTLRGWLPLDGEEHLSYFRNDPLRGVDANGARMSPVYMALWRNPIGMVARVIVTELGDGSIRSRVVLEDDAGNRPVDQVHVYEPDADPTLVGEEIETVVTFIDWAPMGWVLGDPVVTDFDDFLAFDAELAAASADARAVGLLTSGRSN